MLAKWEQRPDNNNNNNNNNNNILVQDPRKGNECVFVPRASTTEQCAWAHVSSAARKGPSVQRQVAFGAPSPAAHGESGSSPRTQDSWERDKR